MKTFKDFTADQQNDFFQFHSIKCDLDAVNFHFNDLLNTSSVRDETDFHNNLVKARTLLDLVINTIKRYENETEDTIDEDA